MSESNASTSPSQAKGPSGSYDPQEANLVRTIIEKTDQKKIAWTRKPDSYSAELADSGVRLVFERAESQPGTWDKFFVEGRTGLVFSRKKKERQSFNILAAAMMTGSSTYNDPLVGLIELLFKEVQNAATGEMDGVIDSLKYL